MFSAHSGWKLNRLRVSEALPGRCTSLLGENVILSRSQSAAVDYDSQNSFFCGKWRFTQRELCHIFKVISSLIVLCNQLLINVFRYVGWLKTVQTLSCSLVLIITSSLWKLLTRSPDSSSLDTKVTFLLLCVCQGTSLGDSVPHSWHLSTLWYNECMCHFVSVGLFSLAGISQLQLYMSQIIRLIFAEGQETGLLGFRVQTHNTAAVCLHNGDPEAKSVHRVSWRVVELTRC